MNPEATIDETLRKKFESAWVAGAPGKIEDCLPESGGPLYLPTLEELVCIDLEFGWKRWQDSMKSNGPTEETITEGPRLESYLKRFDELSKPETIRRLLEQEYIARKKCGRPLTFAECQRRFPQIPAPAELQEQQFETNPTGGGNPLETNGGVSAGPSWDTLTSSHGLAAGLNSTPAEIGNYEILEELGRGGMGIVYKARQKTANRLVALKVIRRDKLDLLPRDSQVNTLDRFRNEAQAAARLDHDNIVTVYEVGEFEGQPFFSMKYVEGASLSHLMRKGPLESKVSAKYLEPVCRAVHEAHLLGVLHRDIKPQNIMVEKKTRRTLVADFGLAKLSEGGEELTRAGEIMGTPPYMSPEQIQDSSQVGPPTDIYALGATLYHMLTGRPPFQASNAMETLRQVLTEEAAPPRQLNPSIDRDLETICIKSIQKEPSKRYESAGALADDLQRYLKGEPILARPVSQTERVVRWCRRNPLQASLIGATLVSLVVALSVMIVAYFRVSSALAESERSFRETRQVVDTFFTRVSEETLLNQPGMQPLQNELLQQAMAYYETFLERYGEDPAVQDELGVAYYRVGVITEKIESPQSALPRLKKALELQTSLVESSPEDPQRLKNIANTWNRLGIVYSRLREPKDSLAANRKALEFRQRLVAAVPAEPEYGRLLANSHMNTGILEKELGHPEESKKELDQAQQIRIDVLKEHPDFADLRRDLAKGYFGMAQNADAEGDGETALKHLHAAIAEFKKLLEKEPGNLDNQHLLALCYRLSGDITPSYDQAVELYQQAVEVVRPLAQRNPSVTSYQREWAAIQMNLGAVFVEQEKLPAAAKAVEEAVFILQPLASTGVPEVRRDRAMALQKLGNIYKKQQQSESAEARLLEAAAVLRGLVDEFGNEFGDLPPLAFTLRDLGQVYADQEKRKEAVDAWNEAGKYLQQLVQKTTDDAQRRSYMLDFAMVLRHFAQESSGEHLEEAKQAQQSAITQLQSLFEETGDNYYRYEIAQTLREGALLEPAASQQKLTVAATHLGEIAESTKNDYYCFQYSLTLRELATAELAANEAEAAQAHWQEALEELKALRTKTEDPFYDGEIEAVNKQLAELEVPQQEETGE